MNSEDDLSSIIKKYAGIIVFISLTFSFLYWLYENIIKEQGTSRNRNTNQQLNQASSIQRKSKMTMNLQGLFPIASSDFAKGQIYQLLDHLSNQYDLFFILLINETDDKEAILNKFQVIIEDNLVYQHRILFCSTIEGLCAMVRSIDPFVHIENQQFVVSNLIRYINEFWFIKSDSNEIAKDQREIGERIKKDTNNINVNYQELIGKIKFINSLNDVIKPK